MNSRKRDKPYFSRHAPYSLPKRRRPLPLDAASVDDVDNFSISEKAPTSVIVIGVPTECSVLDLKSRFEMYGPISRTRMDPDGVAYVNFRSNDSAQSAIDASRDSSFPITLHSAPVQVMWANDPVPQWKGRVNRKDGLSSKLVRPELPLSRHGRGYKLGSAIVNPKDDNDNSKDVIDDAKHTNKLNSSITNGNSSLEASFRGREIVAYDDIL